MNPDSGKVKRISIKVILNTRIETEFPKIIYISVFLY